MIKPKKVSVAIYLLISSSLIGSINSFMVFGFSIRFKELVSLSVTFLMTAVLIYFINCRKNWARIILLVLFLVGIVVLPIRISKTFSVYPLIESIAIISTIFQAVAVILLFNRESNNWFNHTNKIN